MEFEGSYKPRRQPRRYLCYLMLLVPVVTLIVLLARSGRSSEPSSKPLPQQLSSSKNESIQVKDVLQGKFYPRGFNATFLDSKTLQYMSANGDLVLYTIETGAKQVILTSQDFSNLLRIPVSPYKVVFSPSKKYVLVSFNPRSLYRHSVVANYAVINLKTRKVTFLTSDPDSDDEEPGQIQLVQWASSGDSLAFVQRNNVYLLKNVENIKSLEQVTRTGGHVIYNGVADWVYEEEMFNSNVALWLTDSENLAFATFNDTLVEPIRFPVYAGFQYPFIEEIPYPKSGRQNPKVSVSVYGDGGVTRVQLPPVIPQDHYIGSVQWTQDKKLLLVVLNRYQNSSWTLLCERTGTLCDVIHSEEQSGGWLDLKPLVEMGENLLTLKGEQQEDSRQYKHIVEITRNSVERVLTRGTFEVEKILGVDSERNEIFFLSRGHLHVVVKEKESVCLTCQLPCKSVDPVVYPSGGKYFVATCLNGLESIPKIAVYEINPEGQKGPPKTMTNWFVPGAVQIEKTLSYSKMPITKEFKTGTKDGKFQIKLKLLLPCDFDENKKYPILVDVYGGPGSKKINDKFLVDWGVSLVSRKNVIYGMIDGRGAGGDSDDFMFQVYKKFGTVEVEDQIYGLEYLIKTLPYIDKDRTAIWGWSYGGFVTAMAMGKDLGQVYKCGISVAPVTNWGFYDTIYTERYMGLPQENYNIYNDSDITNHLENFRKKQYLLVHGNADDNVHYQQSMYLAKALEHADILFQQQSYPDENHSLGNVRRHLYHTLEHFLFTNCFS